MVPFDSIALSIIVLLFLLAETALYQWADLSFMKRGKDIIVPFWLAVVLFSTIITIGAAVAYVFLYHGSAEGLQTFYAALYVVLWFANALFFLHIQPLVRRAWVSLAIGIGASTLGLLVTHPAAQNVIMLSSLLWISPVVARQFKRLSPLWVALGMTTFALIDTVNVFFARPSTLFSDEKLLLNGIITSGTFTLGIGDFILAYLVVGLTERFYGKKSAIMLACIVPLPRLFIRLAIPALTGRVIPYSLFIVLPALIIFIFGQVRKRNGAATKAAL